MIMTLENEPDLPKTIASEISPLLPTRSGSSFAPSSHVAEPQPPPLSRLRGTVIVVAFSALVFLQSSNFSIMSTTSSPIAADFESYAEVSWFTSAYLIAMSSMSPLFGRLAQIFALRYCVLAAAIIFSVGSLITSQATSFHTFIAGRVIAGIGAAGILTLSIILVIHLTDKRRRGLFIGLANAGVTIGVSLGAVIGGAFVESIGWRELFWAQIPLAAVSGICLFFSIPDADSEYREATLKDKLASIDYVGSLLLVGTLTSFLIGLSSPTILMLPIILSGVMLVLFVLNELYRATSPAIPVSVLRNRGALFTCLAQLGFMTTRWAVLFYSPIYTLAVRGWAPTVAGSILIPTNAGFAIGGLLVGWLHIHRSGSFYSAALTCFILFPITVFVLSQIATPDSNVVLLVTMVFLNGFLVGAGLNYCLAHLLHLTTPDVHYISTSLLATFRGFSGSFGSGISGGLFTRVLQDSLEEGFAKRGINGTDDLVERLLGSPALVYQLEGAERLVAVQGYSDAIKSLFLSGCGLAIISILVQAGTGWKAASEDISEENVAEDMGDDR